MVHGAGNAGTMHLTMHGATVDWPRRKSVIFWFRLGLRPGRNRLQTTPEGGNTPFSGFFTPLGVIQDPICTRATSRRRGPQQGPMGGPKRV